MKINKTFWHKVQREYQRALPGLRSYVCHASPTFKQAWGTRYAEKPEVRELVRSLAGQFLATQSQHVNECVSVGVSGTSLFWCDENHISRARLVEDFIKYMCEL